MPACEGLTRRIGHWRIERNVDRSVEARQVAPRTRYASLDREQNLAAVVATGSDLIRYQETCYGGYEYDQPHGQSPSTKARLGE